MDMEIESKEKDKPNFSLKVEAVAAETTSLEVED